MVIRLNLSRVRLFLATVIWLLGGIWFVSQLPEWWQQGMLQRENLLPLRSVPFINGKAERILVQQAGAHYRFVHRTLQEHIASFSDDELGSLAGATTGG
jgi:hypothetical protein